MPDKRGGLNGSSQHWLAVYLRESQNPKSFADVDLTASYLVELYLGVAGKVGSLREVLAQQSVRVFVGATLPGALWIAEVHLHIRGPQAGDGNN